MPHHQNAAAVGCGTWKNLRIFLGLVTQIWMCSRERIPATLSPGLSPQAQSQIRRFQLRQNIKLAAFLAHLVGGIARDKRGRGEDELEGIDPFQLRLQGFVGVNGEARRGDLELGPRDQGLLEVVTEKPVDVVDDLHPGTAVRSGIGTGANIQGGPGIRAGTA